jgi:hypothetical protein
MPRRKVPPRKKSGGTGHASSRDSIKPVRLPHWRADGNPKVRYPSESEAHRAGFAYRLEHGVDLNAYECEYCGGWHLGASDDRSG